VSRHAGKPAELDCGGSGPAEGKAGRRRAEKKKSWASGQIERRGNFPFSESFPFCFQIQIQMQTKSNSNMICNTPFNSNKIEKFW